MTDYGFVKPKKDLTAYVLGGLGDLPKVVLQPNGQWDEYLPTYEPQAEHFETCGCTVWGTQNCIETILKKLTGKEYNFSERFNYILAGITCPGADPHYVSDVIKDNGLIENDLLPMTSTYREFCRPNPMGAEYLEAGLKWNYDFKHDWVWDWWVSIPTIKEQQEKMMEALQYSPLGVAVFAWQQEGDVYVRPAGAGDVHWCEIFGYVEGEYWKCFDTYDHSIKYLDWNFGFTFVKRYLLIEKKEIIPTKSWVEDMVEKLIDLFIATLKNAFRQNRST